VPGDIGEVFVVVPGAWVVLFVVVGGVPPGLVVCAEPGAAAINATPAAVANMKIRVILASFCHLERDQAAATPIVSTA
jgi:hypothetical protein